MITQQELIEFANYNKDTGVFTRIKGAGGRKANSICGWKSDLGYSIMNINNKKYRCHHLAWLYVFGHMPSQIDHINHDRFDNRISNLREANQAENSRNCSMSIKNTSSYTGVYIIKNKKSISYRAEITFNRKAIRLGHYSNFEDAVNARKQAELDYGFHENHGLKKEGK